MNRRDRYHPVWEPEREPGFRTYLEPLQEQDELPFSAAMFQGSRLAPLPVGARGGPVDRAEWSGPGSDRVNPGQHSGLEATGHREPWELAQCWCGARFVRVLKGNAARGWTVACSPVCVNPAIGPPLRNEREEGKPGRGGGAGPGTP